MQNHGVIKNALESSGFAAHSIEIQAGCGECVKWPLESAKVKRATQLACARTECSALHFTTQHESVACLVAAAWPLPPIVLVCIVR